MNEQDLIDPPLYLEKFPRCCGDMPRDGETIIVYIGGPMDCKFRCIPDWWIQTEAAESGELNDFIDDPTLENKRGGYYYKEVSRCPVNRVIGLHFQGYRSW